jgi:hypothetical protein
MSIQEHIKEFAGYRVAEWHVGDEIQTSRETIYRISLSYDEQEGDTTWTEKFKQFLGIPKADESIQWADKFSLFLDAPNAREVKGLVIGDWGLSSGMQDSASVVATLVEARDRLPNLKAIFLGDITGEECEISWLEQCDVSPLLNAYPQLEHFGVRGANNLSFGQLQHEHLKTLIVQSGGLGTSVINEILTARLPQLQHLELWLGTDNYGGNAKVSDLQPLLDGNLFPNLTYLGLRDSEIADDIAKAIANAPVLKSIKTLDLSLGTLSDAGAQALLASPLIPNLQKLDIHHHFCSEAVMQKFLRLGIEVDTSEQQDEETYNDEVWRYVAVSE